MSPERPSVRYARLPISPKLVRARALAGEIDQLLLELTPDEAAALGYQVRLAQGLTRSLIDQLDELERPPSSSRKSAVSEDVGSYSVRTAPAR